MGFGNIARTQVSNKINARGATVTVTPFSSKTYNDEGDATPVWGTPFSAVAKISTTRISIGFEITEAAVEEKGDYFAYFKGDESVDLDYKVLYNGQSYMITDLVKPDVDGVVIYKRATLEIITA